MNKALLFAQTWNNRVLLLQTASLRMRYECLMCAIHLTTQNIFTSALKG